MSTGVVVVIVIIVVVAGLTGVTRTVEFLVGDECAQIVEANVTGPTISWSALTRVQTLFRGRRWRRRRRVLALLLHFTGNRRWWRQRWRWLWALPYVRGLAVYLHLCGNLLRRRGRCGFRRG